MRLYTNQYISTTRRQNEIRQQINYKMKKKRRPYYKRQWKKNWNERENEKILHPRSMPHICISLALVVGRYSYSRLPYFSACVDFLVFFFCICKTDKICAMPRLCTTHEAAPLELLFETMRKEDVPWKKEVGTKKYTRRE